MMNKKLDRLKQWAGERMGGEVKTGASDEFQNLEMEMKLRHEGAEKLHNTMNVYVKSVSQKSVGEDREKMLPVDVMAQAMISHGEEFESESVFGNCLIRMGQANEKIARVQDSYVAAASESWLESLERFLTQMKEYQVARKKLESRRLAYDATLSKMQKQKKEDSRVEEELRAQRIKYEESSEDVYRRMGDIQESEIETMADLTAFLDAELEYHDRCRDILMGVRQNWPAGLTAKDKKRLRSRTNTAHSFGNGGGIREESPPPPPPQVERPSIRSRVNNNTGGSPESDDRSGLFRMPTPDHNDRLSSKPVFHRTNTSPMPGRFSQYESESMGRRRSDQGGPPPLPATRTLRSANADVFSDNNSHTSSTRNSPDREKYRYEERSASPARSATPSTSQGPSRTSSNSALSSAYNTSGGGRKQAPPPPPVSRGLKKPPPPPPPAKRSQLTAAYEN